MKFSLLLAQFLIVAITASVAQANVIGLPEELNGEAEGQVEYDAAQEMADIYGCHFSVKEVKTLKATYVIIASEEQDAEYAAYPGELVAFTLKATIDLPAKQCQKSGTYTCEMKFDLYDETAYDVDSKLTSCK